MRRTRSGSRDASEIDRLRDRYSGLNNRDVLLLLGQPTTSAAWFALDPGVIDGRIRGLERSMDEILRRIQAIREQIRSGRTPGGSTDSRASEATADVSPDGGDPVPLPDPGPAETPLQIPDERLLTKDSPTKRRSCRRH